MPSSLEVSKTALVAELQNRLEAERDAVAASVASAHTAATHAEAKPENKYDTRGLEASYLAEAQSARLAELQDALARLARMPLLVFAPGDAVKPSALVELELDGSGAGERSWVFLTEVGAGYQLTLPGSAGGARTVTALSPLGRALVGARQGDVVTVRIGPDERVYELMSVL
jgi:transcription elongation GreA/GreB family factor